MTRRSRAPRKAAAVAGTSVLVCAALVAAFLVLQHARSVQAARAACATVTSEIAGREPGPVTTGGPVVAVIGDSYTQGVGLADQQRQAWPTLLGSAKRLTTYVDGIGRTGFTNGGFCGGQEYEKRIDALLTARPELVIVQGGLNDTDASDEEIDSTAEHVLSALAGVPRVVVVGPPPAPSVPGATRVDALLQRVTTSAGRQYVSTVHWNLPYLPDQLHLTSGGHAEFARLLSESI